MAAAGIIGLAVLVALVYARGASASRRWPGWRTIAFFAGLLVVLASLASELEQYAHELFMWVPGDMIFLVAASFAFFRWLQAEEGEQRRKGARA